MESDNNILIAFAKRKKKHEQAEIGQLIMNRECRYYLDRLC